MLGGNRLTRVPQSHQELTQVLAYGLGGKYDAHMDPMDPAELTQMPFQIEAIHDGHYARLMTVFWYLNDVPAGGETNFPSADNDQPVTTMKKSQRALSLTGCCLAKGIACCF